MVADSSGAVQTLWKWSTPSYSFAQSVATSDTTLAPSCECCSLSRKVFRYTSVMSAERILIPSRTEQSPSRCSAKPTRYESMKKVVAKIQPTPLPSGPRFSHSILFEVALKRSLLQLNSVRVTKGLAGLLEKDTSDLTK